MQQGLSVGLWAGTCAHFNSAGQLTVCSPTIWYISYMYYMYFLALTAGK